MREVPRCMLTRLAVLSSWHPWSVGPHATPSQAAVLMCMPAGRGLILRALDSESGMHVVSMLLDRHYRDGVILNLEDVPAMVLLSAPGVLCTWCGKVRGYGKDGTGCDSVHCAMQPACRLKCKHAEHLTDEPAGAGWTASTTGWDTPLRTSSPAAVPAALPAATVPCAKTLPSSA